MNIQNIGNWLIGVNEQETTEFYKNCEPITCSCDYCKNYILYCDLFSPEMNKLFESLCIDPKKEGEVMHFNENDNGTHYYIVFYHFSGKIISDSQFENNQDSLSQFEQFCIDNVDFSTTKLDLVPDSFPEPIVQVIIEFNLPWLL